MSHLAPLLRASKSRFEETPRSPSGGSRKIVALVGQGKGPKVAFRAEQVCVKIRGLTEGGHLVIVVGNQTHKFGQDGDYLVLGGEFAKVVDCKSDESVICELLTGG